MLGVYWCVPRCGDTYCVHSSRLRVKENETLLQGESYLMPAHKHDEE